MAIGIRSGKLLEGKNLAPSGSRQKNFQGTGRHHFFYLPACYDGVRKRAVGQARGNDCFKRFHPPLGIHAGMKVRLAEHEKEDAARRSARVG